MGKFWYKKRKSCGDCGRKRFRGKGDYDKLANLKAPFGIQVFGASTASFRQIGANDDNLVCRSILLRTLIQWVLRRAQCTKR